MKEEDIPFVPAVPVSEGTSMIASAPDVSLMNQHQNYSNSNNKNNTNHYCVDLPIGPADVGIQVHGSPPQITFINKDSPIVATPVQVGHYVHGIALPDIEIVCITDPNQLQTLIQANPSNPRRLYLSSHPFFVDPLLSTSSTTPTATQQQPHYTGVFYKHYLPATTSSLGIGLHGFPPFVTVVAPSSPLLGRLHPGQVVEALVIPGQPIWNLAAGAFTAQKVQECLQRTSTMTGRILIVKDAPLPKAEKGSSKALDDCVIS